MKRYLIVFFAAAFLVGGCAATLLTCPGGPCASGSTGMASQRALMMAALGLLGAGSLAIASRTVWLMVDAQLSLRRLRFCPAPAALEEVMDRADVNCVQYTFSEVALAFSKGGFKPSIIVSSKTVTLLKSNELEAVLLHEAEHGRHRDPFGRALMKATSEILFFVPLVRWAADHYLEYAELRADRAALRSLGPVPVAGALLALSAAGHPDQMAAFAGAPGPRLAQLLGEPRIRSAPARQVWWLSGIGLSVVVAVAWCLASMVSAIIGLAR